MLLGVGLGCKSYLWRADYVQVPEVGFRGDSVCGGRAESYKLREGCNKTKKNNDMNAPLYVVSDEWGEKREKKEKKGRGR